MKKLMLACFLLAGAGHIATAQTQDKAAPAGQQQVISEEHLLFSSKCNELDAQLQRNSMELATLHTVPDLVMMMRSHIDKSTAQLKETKDASRKKELEQQIRTETQLAAEVKQLSIDLAKNKTEIQARLKSFMQYL